MINGEGKAMEIDFGNCIGVWIDSQVHIILDEKGNKIIPSYISINSN